MALLDTDKLLQPVREDAPCGDNLEYDSQFTKMEQVAQPKAEQQFGKSVFEGEEADWKQVRTLAVELLSRSRDLRTIVYYLRASLHLDGWPAFRDGVVLMQRLVSERWESVHPQLDPDDDNDPTLRVNLIASLCDPESLLEQIRQLPIVRAKMAGQFSLRDYELATGDLKLPPPPPKATEPPPPLPKLETIQAAFLECDLAGLQADAEACEQALDAAARMETDVTRLVGVTNSASLDPLRKVLTRISGLFVEQLARRGVKKTDPAAVAAAAAAAATGEAAAAAPVVVVQVVANISSRDDVTKAIDKICEYYENYEPSSPVPLLLKRAKRLSAMSFLDIVRDLSPDALKNVMALGGEKPEGKQG